MGGESPKGRPRRAWDASSMAVASMLVALLPIVVATARGIHGGWVPVGDVGLIAVRSRDVFSSHPPLLFLWSSTSVAAGFGFNHPGPMFLDLMAVPALWKGGAGLAVGVALLNGAALIGIAVLCWRRGGPLLATASMAVTSALCWAMGSVLLFDPWEPNSTLLPLLLFVVLVWSLGCGDLTALPWAGLVGSLLLQSNLSVALVVPTLAVWGLLGLGSALRRVRQVSPEDWPALRRRTLRVSGASTAILAVCWIQPLVEQFTSTGEGNLTLLARAPGRLPSLGARHGLRLFAGAIANWWSPWSLRGVDPSFRSLALAAALVALLAVVLAALVWLARRRGDQIAVMALVTAAVAAFAGLASVVRTPPNRLGILVDYQVRFLLPLAAYLILAAGATAVRSVSRGERATVALVGTLLLVTMGLAAANLPTRQGGTDAPELTLPVVRDLNRKTVALERDGTMYVDWFGSPLTQYYGSAILAALDRRGVPFVVTKQDLVRTLGPERRFNGHNAEYELRVETAQGADTGPKGFRRVVFHEGATSGELKALARMKEQISRYIRDGRLRFSAAGKAALERLERSGGPPSTGRGFNPQTLFATRALVSMARQGFLLLGPRWERTFRRYADVQQRRDQRTVALFLRPIRQ